MPDMQAIEQELRAQYPRPSAAATDRARAAVLAAASQAVASHPGRRWPLMRRRWRPIPIAAGVVIVLAAAAAAIAVSLLDVTPPRFRAAPGWYVGSTRTHSCVGVTRGRCVMGEAWASTVRYRDCPDCVPPHKTLATLPPDGIVIQLTDARERPPYGRRGSWPTQIRASQVISGPFEGEPARIGVIQLVVRSQDGVEHFLFVWFGRARPTARQLARANAELQTVRP